MELVKRLRQMPPKERKALKRRVLALFRRAELRKFNGRAKAKKEVLA